MAKPKKSRITDFLSLNEEQEAVLELDKEVFVQAGAGSGKTRALVARYLHILERGRADVDGIVAITFTENAAAEMRERIRKAIKEYIAKHGERNFLNQDSIKKLPNAPISTIHGFAARIIRENPLESMLNPDFSLLEGVEEGLFTGEVIDEFILRLWESEDKQQRELLSEALAEEGFDLNKLKKTILSIIYKAKTLHLEPPWHVFSDGQGINGDKMGLLEAILRGIETDLGDSSNKLVQTRIEKIRDLAVRLAFTKRDSARSAYISKIKGELQGMFGPRKANEEEKKIAERLLVLIEQILNLYDTRLTHIYLDLSEKAYGFLQEKKREKFYLDYEDILVTARDLLRNNPHLLDYYRRRFKYIMVDEFQDTDSLQFDIVNLLREKGGANLFVVGDPKQSIFRFRGADHTVFLQLIEKERKPKKLSKNYRSKKPLIDFYNGFFKVLVEGHYEDMTPVEESEPEHPCIELIVTSPESGTDWRKEESKRIGKRILGLLEQGYTFRDIAILQRSRSNTYIYENALKELGIPFHSISGGGFFEKPEIRDLWSFLRYLIYPKDRIAQACVLRSPFLGASDDELLAFYHARKEGVPRISEFLDFVANLRNEVKYLGPLSLIEHVIEETGYGASLLALPDGKAKYTNLNKLINIVARLETLGLGISEILDYLESSFGEDAESVPQAELEHENSVKILTVHKAKGLEFPVVILSDLNHAPGGGSRERLMARREKGFMVRCDGSRSSLWESVVKTESEDSLEEEKRILYVAATRAKERLIISVGGKKLKAGNMKLSSGSFAAFLDSVIGFPPNFEQEKQITVFGLEIPLWQGMKEEGTKIEIEDERELKPLNIKDLERRLSFIAEEEEDRSKEYYIPLTHGKPSSVEVGKLMHRFLEVWDFKSDSIDTTIRFVIRENYVVDDTIEKELMVLAKNFLDSRLREKINEAEAIFREVPYYMEINGRADRGKIDLILKDKGKLNLFDYKHISDHDGINQFKEQLGRYTAAIERHFGKAPGENYIVLLPEVRLVLQD